MKLKDCLICNDPLLDPEYGFSLKEIHSYNHIMRNSFTKMKSLIHKGRKP